MTAIPDIPEEIEIQIYRTKFIVETLIDLKEDELNEDVRVDNSYIIANIEFEKYPSYGGAYSTPTHFFTENMK